MDILQFFYGTTWKLFYKIFVSLWSLINVLIIQFYAYFSKWRMNVKEKRSVDVPTTHFSKMRFVPTENAKEENYTFEFKKFRFSYFKEEFLPNMIRLRNFIKPCASSEKNDWSKNKPPISEKNVSIKRKLKIFIIFSLLEHLQGFWITLFFAVIVTLHGLFWFCHSINKIEKMEILSLVYHFNHFLINLKHNLLEPRRMFWQAHNCKWL